MEEFPAPCCCGAGSQAEMGAKYDKVRHRFENEIQSDRVLLHRVTSEVAAGQFPDHYFDWLYLDGNHLYEFVRADLHNFWPKVKPGGYITGDDYGIAGWWGGGVTKAVDEFVRPCNLDLEIEFTQFIVRKPD